MPASKIVLCAAVLLTVLSGVPAWPEQSKIPSQPQEFPVTLHQKIVAGKTTPGTPIQATLTLGTLVSGTVIPAGAVFSGVVVESSAKSAQSPSRLSVRIDSVQWKKGSMPVKAYLTGAYYPMQMNTGEDRTSGPPGIADRQSHPTDASTGNPSDSQPFPRRPTSAYPDSIPPLQTTSDHHVMMKNVEAVTDPDGNLALTSAHADIKLDKSTTYVLATGVSAKEK